MATARKIIVGVDGSPHSVAALRWAARLAPALGCTIEAMSVWGVPIAVGQEPILLPDITLFEEAAKQSMTQALDEAFGDHRPEGLTIRILQGYAAGELVEASREAAMLVLGSRGHGGFAGMLLGSVSMRCAEHAKCPVLVVHGDQVAA